MDNNLEKRLAVILFLILFSVFLIGCSNNNIANDNNNDEKIPELETVSISGIVFAPNQTKYTEKQKFINLFAYIFNNKTFANNNEFKVKGAKVFAFDFNTNKQVGTSCTTDDEGRYTISEIPKSLNTLIIVQKRIDSIDKSLYLSTIIPKIGDTKIINKNSPSLINGTTTIASLRFNQYLGNSNYYISLTDYENVLKEAENLPCIINGSANLIKESSYISYNNNGKLCLNKITFKDFISRTEKYIPKPGYPECQKAKEMINNVRVSGYFLGQTFQEQLDKQNKNIEKISSLINKTQDEFKHISDLFNACFFDIEKYPPANYILKKDGNLELIIGTERKLNNDNWKWNIVEESTNYNAILEITNPYEIFKEYTEPNSEGYNYVIDLRKGVFNLILNQKEDDYYLNCKFNLINNGVEKVYIWDDGKEQAKIYASEEPGYKIEGSFCTINLENIYFDAIIDYIPNRKLNHVDKLSIDGRIQSSSIDLEGILIIKQNLSENENINFQGNIETKTAQYKGNLNLNYIKNINDEATIKNANFNGSFNDLNPNTTTWDGEIDINIDNAEEYSYTNNKDFKYGNIQFNAKIKYKDNEDFYINILQSYNKDENDKPKNNYSISDLTYEYNNYKLTGKFVSEKNDTNNICQTRLNIKNEGKLNFFMETTTDSNIGIEIDGYIKYDNKNIASIDKEYVATVHYIDGSLETLF